MRYLHTMIRVSDLPSELAFCCNVLGMVEVDRTVNERDRFTLVLLAAPQDASRAQAEQAPCIELAFDWDEGPRAGVQQFGHLAYQVDDIYAVCSRLRDADVTINRPPRDGRMAFVRSPGGVSIELLQKGAPLPPREPWASMDDDGAW